jgi:hypothetical protein
MGVREVKALSGPEDGRKRRGRAAKAQKHVLKKRGRPTAKKRGTRRAAKKK